MWCCRPCGYATKLLPRAALIVALTVGGERILIELRKQRQAESRRRTVDIGRAGQA